MNKQEFLIGLKLKQYGILLETGVNNDQPDYYAGFEKNGWMAKIGRKLILEKSLKQNKLDLKAQSSLDLKSYELSNLFQFSHQSPKFVHIGQITSNYNKAWKYQAMYNFIYNYQLLSLNSKIGFKNSEENTYVIFNSLRFAIFRLKSCIEFKISKGFEHSWGLGLSFQLNV